MANVVEFTVDPGLLGAIGSLVPGTKSAISPYGYSQQRALTAVEKRSLHEAGLLDADGNISGTMRRTMEALAETDTFTRIRVVAKGELFEYMTYFPRDNGAAVSITTIRDGILVRHPAPSDEVITGLSQHIGGSIYTSSNFTADVNIEEALTLAAMIDLHRRAVLRAFVDSKTFQHDTYDAHAINEAISNSNDDIDWLIAVVRSISASDLTLSEADIEAALAKLAEADHLDRQGNQYKLSEAALTLANQFRAVENVITVDAVSQAQDGTVIRTSFTCLQSGLHDLLQLEYSNGIVRFACLSSAALLTQMRFFLTNPQALREIAEKTAGPGPEPAVVPGAEVKSVEIQCPSCQAPVGPETKFCGKCGAAVVREEALPSQAVSPDKTTCPECQAPISVSAKFCGKCGAKVGQS
ncbi:zinc ribbon domain-containing protein [Chloroflexota bacterium]